MLILYNVWWKYVVEGRKNKIKIHRPYSVSVYIWLGSS